MKKHRQLLKRILNTTFVIMLLLISISCKKEADKPTGNNKVELAAITIDTVSYSHAYINSQLKSNGSNSISNHGFCWSTQPTPDITKDHIDLGKISSATSFSSVISNLQSNQKYYVRAYATIIGGTIYGTQGEFTTLKTGSPTVITDSIDNIGYTSVRCKYTIQADGGFAITERGLCWSTSHNPTTSVSHNFDGTGKGTYTSSINGLVPNTTYYMRAYGTNVMGTTYGEEKSFVTNILTTPFLTTDTVTSISDQAAISGGNISSDGGMQVIVRGVCWSLNQNPIAVDSHTSDGSGTGSFTSKLPGLTPSTKYYTRAYATNIVGTNYGSQFSFTTSSLICNSFTLTHTADGVAPVTKTITYNTVATSLSGVSKCWITQNLGADHQATSATDATEASAGWYWQFNRTQGYKHDGSVRTPNTTLIYPIKENSDWLSANDPCSILLGSVWRIPTFTEFKNADSDGSWENYNDVYVSPLKIHVGGYLGENGGPLYSRGFSGWYWSSTQQTNEYGWNLSMWSDGTWIGQTSKSNCCTLRCIKD